MTAKYVRQKLKYLLLHCKSIYEHLYCVYNVFTLLFTYKRHHITQQFDCKQYVFQQNISISSTKTSQKYVKGVRSLYIFHTIQKTSICCQTKGNPFKQFKSTLQKKRKKYPTKASGWDNLTYNLPQLSSLLATFLRK